ncbi:MAG TPA: DUF202 domain-containing protein [Myxococcaceae bacterium]|jgi:uncharacterized membrane protein YidH (DUF202 family)
MVAQLDRTYMAASRTLLAMVRTGASIAGGGALVTKLLVQGWPSWVVIALSSAFVILGYWLMWAALKKGRQLRAQAEPGEMAFLFSHRQFAAMTVVLQVLIAAVVALYLLRR